LVYDGAPSAQLSLIAAAAAEHLAANCRCLYLNSPPMVAGFRLKLAACGIDVASVVNSGALVLSSDQDHLDKGEFDVTGMLSLLSAAVTDALADGYTGLWASGDMLWEFGSEKNLSKLLAYELGLEDLMKAQPALSGICQYHRDLLPDEAIRVALCTHEAGYFNETIPRLNQYFRSIEY
jgi:hypothetical protein